MTHDDVRSCDHAPRSLPTAPPSFLSTVAIGVLAATVTALRVRPSTWDSLYSEDGWLFLGGWVSRGAGSVLAPYSGYLHLVPRLVAGAVYAVIPVDDWGRAVTGGACLVVGLLSAILWHGSAGLLRSRALHVAVALVPALTPATGDQVLGNLNCLHTYCLVTMGVWVCAPAATGLVRHRAPRVLRAAGTAAVSLILALTEVQVILLAPLFVWRTVRHRRPGGRGVDPLTGGWALGSLAQGWAAVSGSRAQAYAGNHSTVRDVLDGALLHTVLAPVTSSDDIAHRVVTSIGWGGLALLLGAEVLACSLSARSRRAPRASSLERWAPTAWVALAAALWCAGCLGNGGLPMSQDDQPLLWRWGAAGAMLVTIALLVAVDRIGWLPVRVVTVLLAVGVAAAGFQAPLTYRTGSPSWSVAIAQARATGCDETTGTIRVTQWPTRLTVPVSCALLH